MFVLLTIASICAERLERPGRGSASAMVAPFIKRGAVVRRFRPPRGR